MQPGLCACGALSHERQHQREGLAMGAATAAVSQLLRLQLLTVARRQRWVDTKLQKGVSVFGWPFLTREVTPLCWRGVLALPPPPPPFRTWNAPLKCDVMLLILATGSQGVAGVASNRGGCAWPLTPALKSRGGSSAAQIWRGMWLSRIVAGSVPRTCLGENRCLALNRRASPQQCSSRQAAALRPPAHRSRPRRWQCLALPPHPGPSPRRSRDRMIPIPRRCPQARRGSERWGRARQPVMDPPHTFCAYDISWSPTCKK